MITIAFLILALALVSYLSLFTVVYYFFGSVFLFSRPKKRSFGASSKSVSILVPALNEGGAVISTLESLIKQDHQGQIDIYLLIKDTSDTSVPFLLTRFEKAEIRPQGISLIFAEGNKKVFVACAGAAGKSSKLNALIPQLTSEYTALLDADHRAKPDWIRTSLAIMCEKNARVVQGRRWALSTRGLFRFWDSLQHHVGCQVFNVIYSRLKLNLFFTGTTAVFETKLLQQNPFPMCLTEDTYLSYKLILEGVRIHNNPYSGSEEDLSPDLYSFLARRRRWANGHTDAFLQNFTNSTAPSVPWRTRIHFLLHGQYYFISFLIFVFHLLIGSYLFAQLIPIFQWVVVAVSLSVGMFVSSQQRSRDLKIKLAEVLTGGLWAFPFVVILAVGAARLLQVEFYYYVISFPGLGYLRYAGLLGVFAPIFLLLSGLWGFGELRAGRVVWMFLTFPLALFWDICGNLLGVTDFFLRIDAWKSVARTPQAKLARLTAEPSNAWGAGSIALGFGLVLFAMCLVNDAPYVLTCGGNPGIVGRSLLPMDDIPIHFYLWSEQTLLPDNELRLDIVTNVHQELLKEPLRLRQYFEGNLIQERMVRQVDEKVIVPVRIPLGWETKKVVTEVSGNGFSCRREDEFSTRFIEMRGKELYVNGEPFLIKGIIPNFSQRSIGLSLSEGYRQIKSLGANALRLYHEATPAIIQEAKNAGLLLIDQPDASTWDNEDVTRGRDREALVDSYIKLRNRSRKNPYSLMNLVGNELELGQGTSGIAGVSLLLGSLYQELPRHEPLGYATYGVHTDFSVNVNAVNMLVTGSHFWERGLEKIAKARQPFFASEFGGFQGAIEETPSELRSQRVFEEWDRLLALGALGGVFFQSHDNPAQPAFKKIVDPFSFDYPDDRRGIWTSTNRELPIASTVRAIYSDLKVSVKGERGDQLFVMVKNIRPYRLTSPVLRISDLKSTLFATEFPTLFPGKSVVMKVPRSEEPLSFQFSYTTHQGLQAYSEVRLTSPKERFVVSGLENEESSSWRDANAEILVNGKWESWIEPRPLNRNTRIRVTGGSRLPRETWLVLEGSRSTKIRMENRLVKVQVPEEFPSSEVVIPWKRSSAELVLSADLPSEEFGEQFLTPPPRFFCPSERSGHVFAAR